jgi:hypothetical protein
VKQQLIEFSVFLLFLLSLLYIIGTGGSLELNKISILHTILRWIPGFIGLAVSVILINRYWEGGQA